MSAFTLCWAWIRVQKESVSVRRANTSLNKACAWLNHAAMSPARRSCSACSGGAPASGVPASGLVYVPLHLVQKDQGLGGCSPCMELDGDVAQRRRRRDPAAAHGRSSVRRVLEWRSGRRGSTGRLEVLLRRSHGGQGELKCAGGVKLRRRAILPEMPSGLNSGACRSGSMDG